jgi:hypothetical protein
VGAKQLFSKINNNRFFVNAGIGYQIDQESKISTGIYHGQQSLNEGSVATLGYVNYSMGF